ncbi:MAG: phosphoribosylanthranilate isomerase, partial [Vulcanimicrobiaceae bacterium]
MSARERTRIKFCGLRDEAELALALAAGADALGVILARSSPRALPLERALALGRAVPALVAKVAVVASPSEAEASALCAAGFALQFHGDESRARCEQLAAGRPYLRAIAVGEDGPEPAALREFVGAEQALLVLDSRAHGRLGG